MIEAHLDVSKYPHAGARRARAADDQIDLHAGFNARYGALNGLSIDQARFIFAIAAREMTFDACSASCAIRSQHRLVQHERWIPSSSQKAAPDGSSRVAAGDFLHVFADRLVAHEAVVGVHARGFSDGHYHARCTSRAAAPALAPDHHAHLRVRLVPHDAVRRPARRLPAAG